MKNRAKAGWLPSLAGAAALVLSACAHTTATEGLSLAPGEKLHITREVWDKYQEYLARGQRLGPKKRSGAFGVAVVDDTGLAGLYAYRYCPRDYDNCIAGGPSEIDDVLNACRSEGLECLIFARDDSIQVPYEIID